MMKKRGMIPLLLLVPVMLTAEPGFFLKGKKFSNDSDIGLDNGTAVVLYEAFGTTVRVLPGKDPKKGKTRGFSVELEKAKYWFEPDCRAEVTGARVLMNYAIDGAMIIRIDWTETGNHDDGSFTAQRESYFAFTADTLSHLITVDTGYADRLGSFSGRFDLTFYGDFCYGVHCWFGTSAMGGTESRLRIYNLHDIFRTGKTATPATYGFALFPDDAGFYCRLNDTGINLRTGPSTQDAVVTKLKGDETFMVIYVLPELVDVSGMKGHWVLIQTRNDHYGYIWSEFIEKK
jgi:hypothetical protein